MYGRLEVEYYQLTPIGVQRIAQGRLSGLDLSARNVLMELAELGGTAEIDELKTYGTFDHPLALRKTLRDLVDMGLVTPVSVQPQAGG